MINTIFHFVNDPTFDYQTAVNNGDISEYTIVFNSADHSIHCKGAMFGRMSRADMAETLGNISDLIPVATDSTLGGIKIGYTNNADLNSRRYGVVLDDNNKAYVEVPWTDTITPDFDDTDLKNLIATERSRIDNFISTLSDTIDAKNRQLFADTQWVEEVFGDPAAQGTVAHAFRNEVDNYLNQYSVWDWVDPNDHTKGRTAKISSIELDIDGITTRVGSAESSIDGLTTTTSTLTQRADAIETRVGAVETKADGIDTALSTFEQTVNTEIGGIKTAHTNLSSSVASYETTNDGNIGNLIKMASAVLDLKASSDAQGNLSTTTDLANAITNGSFTGYSGLSQRVSQTESGVSANASLIADVQDTIEGLDVDGKVTRATAGLASLTWVGQNYDTKGSAATAESNAKGYADDIVAGAKAEVIASIDDTVAGMTVLVTKDSNGVIDSGITLKADQVTIDANQTNFKTAVGAFVKTDVLESGVADIKARLTVGGSDPAGSGTPGTITMKDASDGTIGIWDKDKLAVGTTSSPSSSNSAMLVNADGSGSAAKGNISWNANGDVSVNGTGQFKGVVNATQFKAGSDEGFSITTSSDSLDFNYNGARLAFFSLRGWDSTNNQLADVADNPTGFYLYLTNPLDGHLITIDFTYLSFKDLNLNQVLRHEAIFYSLSNINGKAVETPLKLYYSLENNTTKWWLHSDSATELTSSEMGTLYKKQQVNQRGVSYGACVQEVDAGIPYITTNYTLYELQTLQNNAPTKTGNYAMATHLDTDGSRSTDNWFVVPNSTTLLDSLNTNWNGVYRLDDGRVKSTTATTVIQSSNNYTVPTFTSAVSFISVIDENGNVESILYPAPSL